MNIVIIEEPVIVMSTIYTITVCGITTISVQNLPSVKRIQIKNSLIHSMGHSGTKQAKHAYYMRQKLRAYEILGDRCVHCGFFDVRALQLDHIHGDGYKESARGRAVSNYIKVIQGSKKFQLLCANCNWIKRVENGEHRYGRLHKKEEH